MKAKYTLETPRMCYCCAEKTTDFSFSSWHDRWSKHCRSCMKKYSAAERHRRELQLILSALKNVCDEEVNV